MTQITVSTEELRKIIHEEIRKVFQELIDENKMWCMMEQASLSILDISDEEQTELEDILGDEPPKREPFKSTFHKTISSNT